MKFRYIFMVLGSLLTLLALVMSDPSSGMIQDLPIGGGTVAMIIILSTSVLYISMLYLGRKAILDYVDLREFFKTALRSPEGAGAAIIGVGLMMVSVAIVILAATN